MTATEIQTADQPKSVSGGKFVTLCGRIFHEIDPQYFPSAHHRGRLIRFCTESCLGAFLADPDIFYKVHRNSEQGTFIR